MFFFSLFNLDVKHDHHESDQVMPLIEYLRSRFPQVLVVEQLMSD